MRRSVILLTAILLIPMAARGGSSQTEALMNAMPDGYDIYITLNPEAVGVERMLGDIAGSSIASGNDLELMQEAIGFPPLDWNAWAETLALEPNRDIGFLVGGGGEAAELVCIYIPSSDPASVERFFEDIMGYSGEFEGDLSFTQAEGYTIVVIAESPEIALSFDPNAPQRLDSSPDLAMLTDPGDISSLDAVVFIRFRNMMQGDALQSLLLSMKAEGLRLNLDLAAYTTNADAVSYSSLLSGSPAGAGFRIPSSNANLLGLSLDMELLSRFLVGSGTDRDLSMGIQQFGFDSFTGMLAAFSGDVCVTYGFSEEIHSGSIQFGLTAPEAVTNLLALVRVMLDGAEGSNIQEFDHNGNACYRIEDRLSAELQYIEFGVVEDVLVLAGNQLLGGVTSGVTLTERMSEQGLGTGADHPLVAIASLPDITSTAGIGLAGARQASEGGELDRIAAALDVQDGLFLLSLVLETTEGDPYLVSADLLANIALGMLARPVR